MFSEAFKKLTKSITLSSGGRTSSAILTPIECTLLEHHFSSEQFCELIDSPQYKFPAQCHRFITANHPDGHFYVFEYDSPRGIVGNTPKTVSLYRSAGELVNVFIMDTLNENNIGSWEHHLKVIGDFGYQISLDVIEYLSEVHPGKMNKIHYICGI